MTILSRCISAMTLNCSIPIQVNNHMEVVRQKESQASKKKRRKKGKA